MNKLVLAVTITVSMFTTVTMASAEISCGDKGHLMIYDVTDVRKVVRGGYNMLIAQKDGTFSDGWTFEPSERGCTKDEFHNFVLRAADGTQIERLPGVDAIGELVRALSPDEVNEG